MHCFTFSNINEIVHTVATENLDSNGNSLNSKFSSSESESHLSKKQFSNIFCFCGSNAS